MAQQQPGAGAHRQTKAVADQLARAAGNGRADEERARLKTALDTFIR